MLNTGAPLNADAFERAISDYQAASHPQPAYQPQQRLVQADGSWLIPALLRTDTGYQQLNTFFQRERALFAVLEVRLPEDDETLLRQLDIAIDTFTLNPDAELGAGQVAQAAAPLDAFGGGVVGFGGMYTWTDGSGGFHINGQVVNNDIAALEFVRLTAYLYDTAGNLLAEQSDYAASDVLMPGQYAPFNLRFVGGRPPAAARYEVHAAARHAGARVESHYGPSNFTIEDHADFNVHGHLIVSGTVTNSGPLPANYVKVTVTIFDGEGRVVATDTTFVQQQLLFPGQSTAFQLTFFELGGDATRYLTSAQAVRSE